MGRSCLLNDEFPSKVFQIIMFKHKGRIYNYILFSRTRRRIRRAFSTSSFPLEPTASSIFASTPQLTHKDLCFSLANQLISRGLLSSAQKVIQRLISKSSVSEALAAADFAHIRGMQIDSVTFGCLIRKLVTSGESRIADTFYVVCIVGKGIEPDCALLNSMVICYCKLGRIDEGKSYFDRLIQLNHRPCIGACNAIIRGFCEQNRVLEGYDCFTKVSDFMLNYTSYNRLVDSLCFMGYLVEARHVFDVMMDRGVRPTFHLCKLLIFEFCKRGWVEVAELLSVKMESYDLSMDKFMYTYLIYGYCKGRKMKMAMRLFMRMLKVGCEPDNYTYNTLIHGFVHLGMFDEAWLLRNKMVSCGLKPNILTYQIMISKHCKDQKVDYGFELLNYIIQCNIAPNVHCYTVLISALCKEQRFEEVNSLYLQMLGSGIIPDHVLFFTMINAYSKNGWVNEACKLFENISEYDLRPNYRAYTVLITGLVKKNMTEKACLYLDRMLEHGLKPNVVIYTSLINQFLRKREFEFAFRLVDVMEKSKIEKDLVTYIALISGVSRNIRCVEGKWYLSHAKSKKAKELMFDLLHQSATLPKENSLKCLISSQKVMKSFVLLLIHIIKNVPFMPNLYLYNGIISGLCWAGSMTEAYDHLNRMQREEVQPNQVTFTILIDGHIQIGETDRAVDLFKKINASGIDLDQLLYNTLLRGLIKARRLFDALYLSHTMQKRGFSPSKLLYQNLLSWFCANQSTVNALRICEDMHARGYVPCNYNLHRLISILYKDNKLDKSCIVRDLILKKRKIESNRRQKFIEKACRTNES